MFCRNCGTQCEDTTVNCPNCGYNFVTKEMPAEETDIQAYTPAAYNETTDTQENNLDGASGDAVLEAAATTSQQNAEAVPEAKQNQLKEIQQRRDKKRRQKRIKKIVLIGLLVAICTGAVATAVYFSKKHDDDVKPTPASVEATKKATKTQTLTPTPKKTSLPLALPNINFETGAEMIELNPSQSPDATATVSTQTQRTTAGLNTSGSTSGNAKTGTAGKTKSSTGTSNSPASSSAGKSSSTSKSSSGSTSKSSSSTSSSTGKSSSTSKSSSASTSKSSSSASSSTGKSSSGSTNKSSSSSAANKQAIAPMPEATADTKVNVPNTTQTQKKTQKTQATTQKAQATTQKTQPATQKTQAATQKVQTATPTPAPTPTPPAQPALPQTIDTNLVTINWAVDDGIGGYVSATTRTGEMIYIQGMLGDLNSYAVVSAEYSGYKAADNSRIFNVKKSVPINKDEFMIPDSEFRLLTEADIAGMTADELKIARNEIYARHGRKFKDNSLNEYFLTKSWYGPNPSYNYNDDFSNLSAIEDKNAHFLRTAEEALRNQ